MTFTEEQVEWIVSEVIRRLLSQGVAVGEPGSSTVELTINDKVITLRTIEGKLNGVKQLRVPPRAVVTPAVKDELRMRNVELAFKHT
jgi:hypothetical protein